MLDLVVKDPAGGVIVSANVSIKSTETGSIVRGQTSQAGQFTTPLPVGLYEVSVSSFGFRTITDRVEIKLGKTLRREITLMVGSVAEQVFVRSYNATEFGTKEEYAINAESGFVGVSTAPRSTFSADVDTASYSNIRRFLRDGRLPPPDAVRVEEMLNSFRYNYPQPASDQPLSITSEIASCPWNSEHLLLRVGLRAKAIETAHLPPSNLVFLIDVSGSMSGPNRLPLVKRSFALLAESLRKDDSVAIVVYAGAAGLVLPSTRDKTKVLDALSRLEAGGSTAGGAGLRLAYQVARESFIKGGNNRVVLATDGDFNVGQSSDDEMIRLVEQERESGVFLTVLGFGMGNLKDSKLEKLADHGNGHYGYIDDILEARRMMVREMGATLHTVAKDVKLQVEFNPTYIQGYRLIGYENRRLRDEDFRNDKKDAGDLGSGHMVTAFYELVPASGGAEPLRYQESRKPNGEALIVHLRYKEPDGEVSKLISKVVPYRVIPIAEAAPDFAFGTAVVQFGLLLRDSPYKGSANYDSMIRMAQQSAGEDEDGRRAELLYLAKTARDLKR